MLVYFYWGGGQIPENCTGEGGMSTTGSLV